MSNYQLYQEVLASAGEGTPLWEPVSSPSHHTPSVGDVGYLRFGGFIRLFNAMLPPGHPDNEDGEPENYVPLVVPATTVHQKIIPPGVIAATGVQTTGVSHTDTCVADSILFRHKTLKEISISDAHIHFKCTAKAGAVVMSSSEVYRKDVARQGLGAFANYMMAHAHEWAKFARFKLMHEVALHELILMTGCDITKGKYSVTVFNSARLSKRADASFQLSPNHQTWSHSPMVGYFQHNHGPRRAVLAPEQCLFVRGFKVLDRRVEQLERRDEAESWFVENCCATQVTNISPNCYSFTYECCL